MNNLGLLQIHVFMYIYMVLTKLVFVLIVSSSELQDRNHWNIEKLVHSNWIDLTFYRTRILNKEQYPNNGRIIFHTCRVFNAKYTGSPQMSRKKLLRIKTNQSEQRIVKKLVKQMALTRNEGNQIIVFQTHLQSTQLHLIFHYRKWPFNELHQKMTSILFKTVHRLLPDGLLRRREFILKI